MYKILFFTSLFFFTIVTIGCGGGESPNVNKPNTNTPPANNGNTVTINPTPKPVGEKTNDAPTLAPVVKSYYEALKKKDDALLKTVLSAAFVKDIEADMKEEKKTGLAAYMAETDRVADVEVRNESIQGDKGIAELKGGTYINWTKIGFVKEDGKWKLSNESPDIQAVKPTDAPSNTAK